MEILDADLKRIREHLYHTLAGNGWDELRWWPAIDVRDRYEREIQTLENQNERLSQEVAKAKTIVAKYKIKDIDPAPRGRATMEYVPSGRTRGEVIRYNASIELRKLYEHIKSREAAIQQNAERIAALQDTPPVRMCRLKYRAGDRMLDTVFVLKDYIVLPAGRVEDGLLSPPITYFKE